MARMCVTPRGRMPGLRVERMQKRLRRADPVIRRRNGPTLPFSLGRIATLPEVLAGQQETVAIGLPRGNRNVTRSMALHETPLACQEALLVGGRQCASRPMNAGIQILVSCRCRQRQHELIQLHGNRDDALA